MHNKLNILYVTKATSLSGGARQLFNNVLALSRQGHSVIFCGLEKARVVKELQKDCDCKMVFIDKKNFFQKILFFLSIIKQNDINVIHCFHGKLYKILLIVKIFAPQVKLFLNRGVIFPPGSFPLLWLPQLDGIICNSHAASNVLRKYLVPAKKIHVIYNSVSPPEKIMLPRHIPHDKDFTVTYIGNRRHFKGLDIFLKSAEIFLENQLNHRIRMVVGGIDFDPRFQQYVNKSTLEKMQFAGSIPHEEIFGLLQSTDIFVITSRQESLPNTLLEAYAMGVSVISAGVGGIPEVLQDKHNGFLCPKENPSAIADKMAVLYNDPELRKEIARNNKKHFNDNFKQEQKCQKLLKVYSGQHFMDRVLTSASDPEIGHA